MAIYAIIEDSGTQIRVSEGDIIKVAIREMPENASTLTFNKVLFVGGTDAGSKIGLPLVTGATVTADLLAQEKTDRVEIRKFRRRKNYRRHRGHRQDYFKIKITSIVA